MRLLHFHFKNQNRPRKGTGAKHDVCPGSSASTWANYLVALVESAHMLWLSLDIIHTTSGLCLTSLFVQRPLHYARSPKGLRSAKEEP